MGVFSVRWSGRAFHPFSRLKCCVPVLLCAVVGLLAFTGAPALAAAPEAPETKPATVDTATTATVHGVLDPHAASTELVVEYIFFYAPGGAACTEGSVAPESLGMATGKEAEKVEVALAGLQPNAHYEVCLAARNPGEEAWTVGNAVPFTTPPARPAIESLSAANVKTSEVTLEGVVNPNNEATECEFQYGTVSVSENTWPCKPELLKGFGGQGVSSTKLNEQGQTVEAIAGLSEGTTYKYRILVKNEAGPASKEGVFQTFETPEAQKATAVRAATAIFNGVLNPKGERKEEPGSYEFLYRQSATECRYVLSAGQERELEAEHRTAELEADRAKAAENKNTASEAATGAKEEPVKAEATGLLPGTQYTFCLLVRDASGAEAALGAQETFTTGAAEPKIEGAGASDVRDTSATLQARIDPGGALTTYTFEYAPAGGSFIAVPGGSGTVEGATSVPVSAHLQGLNPRSEYLFQVVVGNSVKTVTSEPVSFTTQRTGVPFSLADGREWEMVSPPQKQGAQLEPLAEGIIQAAADGEAFSGESAFEPIEGEAVSAYGFFEDDFFGRGSTGWVSRTITPPHSAAGTVPVGNGQEYRFFSQDLSKAILQPFGQTPPLAPNVSQTTVYLRTNFLNGDRGDLCSTGCFKPLVEDGNVPPGTPYGGETTGACKRPRCGPEVLGATPDLGHVLLASPADLTGDAPAGGGLYEWSAGQLAFIGKGTIGSALEGEKMVRHAISDDGSRVFINGSYEGVEGLLMRDAATGETIRLDVPPASPGQPEFETASADGSKVFFTDGPPHGFGEESERSLYEYDLSAPVGSRLTDLSVAENTGEQAGVTSVIGASEDGSYVYFAATGALTPGAVRAPCNGGRPCMNVYVRHAGVTKLVAALSGDDSPDWRILPSKLTARVSPDGRWFAFMSNRELAGYDTTDAVSGNKDEEVYLYHAGADRLICASCNPTGARPSGEEYGSTPRLVTGDRVFDSSTWIASNVPPVTRFELTADAYQSRYLSDGGRLFFDSHDALAPQDVNGTQDVYEYEPPKSVEEAPPNDTCSTESSNYSPRSDGCVSLISSGESSEESAFLDASESGSDVFFLTSAGLAQQDLDGARDIYDARECGVDHSRCFPRQPVAAPPCESGDACKAAPSPQPSLFGSPASATFSGTGNVTSAPTPKKVTKGAKCPKGKARSKHGKCIKARKKKKTKARKAAKRATNGRRGN